MGADELVRYINSGKSASSMPPSESAYTEFFASQLKRAHHVIHIAITTSMSDEYTIASDAADSFDNVTVINSGCLSSATGILVLIALRLTQITESVDEVVEELELIKQRLQCSFIIDTTEFMAKGGRISSSIDNFARALSLHPCVRIANDKSEIGGIWAGNQKRAYKKYINKAFPVDVIPDPEVVFITYIGVPTDTLLWIRDEISKIAFFENVVFQQASAAISSNCGPGAFGILYFIKSNKSYNLSRYFEISAIENDTEAQQEIISEDKESSEKAEESTDEQPLDSQKIQTSKGSKEWFHELSGIDGDAAIKHSGSEEAFRSVLQIFYDSIDNKSKELSNYLEEGDIQNYTIKVHALKSSCKLIGALETAEKAQLLENAGKEGNTEYIRENHSSFITEYQGYKDTLKPLFAAKDSGNNEKEPSPLADASLIESVYEELLEAANAMDCEEIENILNDIKGYTIPESEKEKFDALKEMANEFDYDGIITLLS